MIGERKRGMDVADEECKVMRQRALSVTKGKDWYGLCSVVPAVVRCSVLYSPSLGTLISPDLRRLFSLLTKSL